MSLSSPLDEMDNYTLDGSANDIQAGNSSIPPVPLKCNQYIIKDKPHIIYGGYEGIPENLLINFLGWLVLLTLFTVLRKKAWNYGRLALVQKHENRASLHGYSRYNVWTHIFYGTDKDLSMAPGSETDSISSIEIGTQIDKGFLSWIPALLKMKDELILAKSGRDAVQYLSFQRHIIIFATLVCVICITVILPINFQGTLEGGENEFGHTTLSNLDPHSNWMWIHVTLAFIFLPLGILFTRRFSRMLEVPALSATVSRTLMITKVPRRSCHKDTLLRHFQEAYPNFEVQDIQFAYDIKKLVEFDKERELVHRAKLYCESYLNDTGTRLEMRAYKCGVICGCCDIFGCPKVDAIQFYTQEEQNLTVQVEDEKVKALQHPTGIAFVTLDTVDHAKKVQRDHSPKCYCGHDPPSSFVYKELKPHNWIIHVAPSPDDIYWSNLSITNKWWYLKAIFINFLLFLFLFFLTTPAVVINSLDIFFSAEKLNQMSPVLSEFLPTLMLWTVAALMPVIVAYSDQFMSHWTRSGQNHAIMRKTFIFLLFMLIILPSLGFTSAKAFVEWFLQVQNKNQTYRWECVFLPDNGAFFVNYVITSAFIGTSLELIRLPELFMYIIRMGLARSEAETASIRKNIMYEFQFGVQYAWMLLNFAMTIIYSVSCPLITPFGLLYLIFKHLVDKYNIYFAYGPSKIRKSIHTSAVNFVIVILTILQVCLLFFSILRLGIKKPLTIYSIVLLCITFLVFMTHIFFHWFKDFSPIEYKPSSFDSEHHPIEEEEYIPDHPETDDLAGGSYQFIPQVLRSSSIGGDDTPVERTIRNLRKGYGTTPEKVESVTEVEAPLAQPEHPVIEESVVSHQSPNSQTELTHYQNYSPQAMMKVDHCLPHTLEEVEEEGGDDDDENTVYSWETPQTSRSEQKLPSLASSTSDAFCSLPDSRDIGLASNKIPTIPELPAKFAGNQTVSNSSPVIISQNEAPSTSSSYVDPIKTSFHSLTTEVGNCPIHV